MQIVNALKAFPVIAAARNAKQFETALKSDVTTIFILSSDIFNVAEMVAKAKALKKYVFVHMDFIGGLASDPVAIDYLFKIVAPTGIISTKAINIKYANSINILAIQRFFIIDSQSYLTMLKTIHTVKPNIIEILPGVMPNIISRVKKETNIPVIAGGLIDDKEHADIIIAAGAFAASTSKENLWIQK